MDAVNEVANKLVWRVSLEGGRNVIRRNRSMTALPIRELTTVAFAGGLTTDVVNFGQPTTCAEDLLQDG